MRAATRGLAGSLVASFPLTMLIFMSVGGIRLWAAGQKEDDFKFDGKALTSLEPPPDETKTAKRPIEMPTPEMKAVIDRLKATDVKVREEACRELLAFQQSLPRTAAEVLVDVVINDDDAGVRLTALGQLPKYLAEGEWAAPFLVKALDDQTDDEAMRIQMCRVLGFVGCYEKDLVSDALTKQLLSTSSSVPVRYVSALSLGMIGADSDAALDALVANIESVDSYVDEAKKGGKRVLGDACLKGFSLVRRPYPKAVPSLVKKLQTGKPEDVKSACMAVRAMGPAAADATPALLSLIEANQPVFRSLALSALEKIGPAASTALPNLKQLYIAEQNPSAKSVLLRTIAKVARREPDEVVPLLVKHLSDRNFVMRQTAFAELSEMGPAAKSAIPELEAIIENDRGRRRAAILTLDNILGVDALDEFTAFLSSDQPEDRNRACIALAKIGPPANEAHSALSDLAKEGDLLAIQALGPVAGEEAVPELIKMLGYDDYKVADAAAQSLMLAGPGANAAIPMLQSIAKNRELKTALRTTALKAISRITYPAAK